ncbi:glycoside hydrolase [Caulobacter flavus]|uniref:Glycoside hydrolase n=1 Tax=Caulobacter flavus TaxID=1679497 RepID=A0A2N5CSU1_9CAUL|nr:sugar-binding domain-containing protein [Caulobacter flavus]AYV47621.1 glycoside hydrolase [Caulobacter flavus]PLR14327.1 glycoside hydrolase [Caulobacter flavus]
MKLDRRSFLAAGGAGLAATGLASAGSASAADLLTVPDEGWSLWIDQAAPWKDDALHLPSAVDLTSLPVNPPTGGWVALKAADAIAVSLPTTVEEHFWGKFASRPYGADEYRYAEDDDVPRYGAYKGVSWWSRSIDIPASAKGKRVLLNLRGARLRAEVFLNERLVGYSIMSELPFSCDLTAAMRPGEANRLAIRITNPGGRFDWRDSTTMVWGKVKLFASHGFGGLDRGVTLSVHPLTARIDDAWVLNTPQPRTVTAFMDVVLEKPAADPAKLRAKAAATLVDDQGAPVAADIRLEALEALEGGRRLRARFTVSAPKAELWDLDAPRLHRLRLSWAESKRETDTREVRFGFRWFGVEGVGTDALLRLNGRRIRLYSAISWGYWGFNGLWPTKELARREVTAAHTLGLNALHFHRNVGKPEVFQAMDEMGLLRVMEPGGGRHAIGRDLKPGESLNPADAFSRQFMVEKCQAMVRAFRSHPSLAHYTLQNEIGANLANPDVQFVLKAMHDLDPSRAVILNDGFVKRGAAQAMYLPYNDHYFRSDVEEWGGWWVEHQGAGDQWYDRFYASKDDYIHMQKGKPFIVEFGEMQGCAVADNHVAMVAEILARGGNSYDLEDHKVIVERTNAYLDRWGFRKAFPTTEALFLSVGRKAYEAWRNYLENIRLGETVDVAAISGWESTAIENHSGIVDVLRGFKADPTLMSQSLRPTLAVARPRKLAYAPGEAAELDIWLFNDTGRPITGELALGIVGPDGVERAAGRWPAPAHEPDRMSWLVAESVRAPAFEREGRHVVRMTLAGSGQVVSDREVWVAAPAGGSRRKLRIAVSGVAKSLRVQLEKQPGVTIEEFKAGVRYDGIVASGLKADEIVRRQVGEQTGLEAQPKKGEKPQLVLGELPPDVLAAVSAGTPLLAVVQEEGLAEGVARQLAGLGLFSYAGQVGGLRAPWMGNWNYVRAHPTFAGIPSDMAMSVLHQVEGQPSNGLLVDGEGVEVIAAYSRDHDRHNGAASFIARKGAARVLVHRLPDMVAPLQTRWLSNALDWLAADPITSPGG